MLKRQSIIVLAVLALIIMFLCTIIPFTVAADSSLQVEVRDEYTQNPIAGVTVLLTGPVNRSSVTGTTGVLTFSGIPSGTYTVSASSPDYPIATPHVVLVSGKTTTVIVFSNTKALFTYSPKPPLVNETVTFNGTASSSSAPITDYNWDFGDGTTGTGVAPTHSYAKVGTYTAVLTVTSIVGTATYQQNIQVGPNENGPPWFPWILLIIPFLFIIPLILFWRRRRYYVIIQARVPAYQKHPHCPGDNTKCQDCKMSPC